MFNDANRREKLMALLIRYKHEIAALAPLLRHADGWSINFNAGQYEGPIDATWFAKHANHNLVPMSEYGEVLTVACEACKKETPRISIICFQGNHRYLCEECGTKAMNGKAY